MPRTSAVASNILLASTSVQDPMEPMDDVEEVKVREVEVQTMFRESEAQTHPYAPSYTLRPGETPTLLLMADFHEGSGLPIGEKEATLIAFAELKRDLESNMPPFTDEASLSLRKKLTEEQEVREMQLRENAIDARRDIKMEQLEQALAAREEMSEFATAQRVEGLRTKLLEEREKKLQQVRTKRVKVLRRLTEARERVDPLLSDSNRRDIIGEYFDKGSTVYAPRTRLGKIVKVDTTKLDARSRTATLMSISNVEALEASIPSPTANLRSSGGLGGSLSSNGGEMERVHAFEERLTSAAQRSIRRAKKDVETMSKILNGRKTVHGVFGGDLEKQRGVISMPADAAERARILLQTSQSKARPRPSTPDMTRTRDEEALQKEEEYLSSVMLLQRLIRGRSSQNLSYEGKFRRAELIAELRQPMEESIDLMQEAEEQVQQRNAKLRESSIAAAVGAIAASTFVAFAKEFSASQLNGSPTNGSKKSPVL